MTWHLWFPFFEGPQSVFLDGCPHFHYQQQHTRVLFSAHPSQHLLCRVLLTIAMLTGVRQCLFGVFICQSLMISDVECFIGYLLAICTTFIFVSHLLRYFAQFSIMLFAFLQWSWVHYVLGNEPPHHRSGLQVFCPILFTVPSDRWLLPHLCTSF